jgi:signal transduction histidine kinase
MQGRSQDLLNVVGADGFTLLVKNSSDSIGVTPTPGRIRELQTQRRQRETDPALFASGALVDDLGVNDIRDGIAGAIFVSLRDRPDTTMIWFRKERHYSVRWGGDPDHPHTVDESGRLSPRKSFALFMQNIRGRCIPWSPEELDSATELGSLIDIETMRERDAFAKTILDSSPEHIAVINPQGIIVEVNNAWKHFAQENGAQDVAFRSVGMNYRAICEAAMLEPSGLESATAWAGIETVLSGTKDNFTLDYPCDSPSGQHWFRMSVYPLIAPGNGAVIAHENITARKQAEEKLREMTSSLEAIVASRTRQIRQLSSQLAMTEERERRQLAENLHDNLCQLLAIAKIKLSSFNGSDHSTSIEQIMTLVTQADRSARMITQQLSPPVLRTLGLVPALESLAESLAGMYRLTVDFDIETGSLILSEEIEALVYRSLRELLINVAKHAKVDRASVSVACSEDQLVVAVSDDGGGLVPPNFLDVLPPDGAFGLHSVFERVTCFGGEMNIDSSPGNGTTVTLSFPRNLVKKDMPK